MGCALSTTLSDRLLEPHPTMPPLHVPRSPTTPLTSPARRQDRYSPDGIGVYIHFPWCLTKCPYCDFHSIALQKVGDPSIEGVAQVRAQVPHESYADAIIAELSARGRAAWSQGHRPRLKSIFFGGGTPSLWAPEQLGRVVSAVLDQFESDDPEITVECNPTSVDREHFVSLLEARVNRVSLGVQALEDSRLAFLGRLHRASRAMSAISEAELAGVPRISADLMFGVYRQPKEAAVGDAARVAQTGVGHLSAYALTIEQGTRFGALHARGRLPLLDEDQIADSFEAVSACLAGLGFEHYEISNFARHGQESVHNLGYWMGRDYLGLGCGAFGTVSLPNERVRYKNVLSPERYMDHFDKGATRPFEENLAEREVIEPKIAMDESLLLGLRTREGVLLDEVAELRGASLPGGEQAQLIERFLAQGILEAHCGRLRLRREKWLLADHVLRQLL